jgi:16S rRNA (cytosine967-C5)-methyltransferase
MKPAGTITGFAFEHAVRALAQVLPGGAAADRVLSTYFRANPNLGSADRSVVAETVYAALRNRRSLAACAGSEFPRDLALAALVRVRGLNLKQCAHFLRDGESELLGRIKAVALDALPEPVRHDLPDWVWQRLVDERGQQGAVELARALKGIAPLTLRANSIKATREDVIAGLAATGLAAHASPFSPHGVVVEGKPALQRHPMFLSGAFEVQDEGSQLLAELLAPRRGEMVADFCAGAGGKTLALGALMRSTGRLYAFDVSAARLAKFKLRQARSGLSNVHPLRIESENDIRVKRLAGKIDRVLVDAPCSGLGTLRRNPELKWRQMPADVEQLAAKQFAILVAAGRLVKPGGRLVYATCSVLAEENARVVARFLAATPDFQPVCAADVLQSRGISIPDAAAGDALELLPQRHGTDGFYAMAMERGR